MSRVRRRPAVFELDALEFNDTPEPDESMSAEDVTVPTDTLPPPARRRWSWWGLFLAGVSGLSLMALSFSVMAFLEDMFTRSPVLGWTAVGLAALMLLGLFGMVLREWLALRRLGEVTSIRERAEAAAAEDDGDDARVALNDLMALYANRPTTQRGRKALEGHMRQVIDGRDLIGLAERDLLAALDRQALDQIISTSRRVAAVTALSPRALVDLAYVVFASTTLVRRIATIYGGRPGTLGSWRVLRLAVVQLAVTGGMAAGDSMLGEIVGHGLATKLSAKLGEGVVNGLMTARLGLAALDVLRPLPFVATRRPRVNDVLGEIGRVVPRERE